MKRRTKLLLGMALIAVGLGMVGKFVVSPYLVVGASMTPALEHMDLCVMRKVWRYRPQRGDIVVFRTADEPALHFVKRVVALPGETVAISNGVVVIDGAPLREQHVELNPEWDLPATAVSADKVYVIGDNRTVPLDETVHGLVATRLIKGRLITHWRWKR